MTKELIVTLLEQAKTSLVNTFEAVPDDKLDWKPLDNGRSALDLFGEAAQTASLLSMILQTGEERPPMRETFQRMREQRADWSRTDALDWMQTNHGSLITQIQTLTDEQLGEMVTMPMGGGMTLPLAAWIMMIYRSYISRFAQINYIQTLYGDFEPH